MASKEIGAIIKEARLSKKMTQNEVVGDFITRNMLSLIENGTATPSIRTLQYLAAKLQIPMSQFSFDEDEAFTSDNTDFYIWLQGKHSYANQEYNICLDSIAPFLAPEHALYDEACSLAALCHLNLANQYTKTKNLSKAIAAAKQANHYASLGIFHNQQIMAESVLLLNQLAQEYQQPGKV